jgi:hypothetical protein
VNQKYPSITVNYCNAQEHILPEAAEWNNQTIKECIRATPFHRLPWAVIYYFPQKFVETHLFGVRMHTKFSFQLTRPLLFFVLLPFISVVPTNPLAICKIPSF